MAVRPEVLIDAVASLITAGIYVYVALLIRQRALTGEAARANHAFALWWVGLGVTAAGTALFRGLQIVGYADLALATTLVNVILIVICIALGSLVYFLAYVYTGSGRGLWPIAVVYTALALAFLYAIAWMGPTGFRETALGSVIAYARPMPQWASMGLGLALSVPVLGAAIAYASLYARVRAPIARYRIGIVSGAFLAWFGWSLASTLLAFNTRFPDAPGLVLVNRMMGLAVPLLIVLAYRPPYRLRMRLEARALPEA